MGNTLTQWTGAMVTLHKPDSSPDIYGKSITLYPGTETKIGVSLVNITKLRWNNYFAHAVGRILSKQINFHRAPWSSECVEGWPPDFPYPWQPYSKALCSNSAVVFLESIKVCGCAPSLGRMNGVLETNARLYPWCTPGGQVNCLNNLMTNITEGKHVPELSKHCKPLCVHQEYEVIG